MSQKVWFITGASRGFGRIWAEEALKRGDKVVATARVLSDVASLAEQFGDSVLPLALDVTKRDQVTDVIAKAHEHFGRLDILVNNAGYALFGAVEETSEAEVRAEFETNVFGPLAVIQAALPFLRAQGSGHIIGVSSVAGIESYPMLAFYNASKWAFEALHDSLSKEVAQFGIKVTLLEPNAYATDFASQSSMRIAAGLEPYAEMRAQMFAGGANTEFGDPAATSATVLKAVDSAEPPLRLFLGSQGLPTARRVYAERLAIWEAWEAESNAAQGVSRKQTLDL